VNADFESGKIETSDWISGDHIEFNNDVVMWDGLSQNGEYNITPITSSSILEITTNSGFSSGNFESTTDSLKKGNIVYLNNVYYEDNTGNMTKLGDTYKINNDDFKITGILSIKEIKTNIISTLLDTSGTFSSPDTNIRYGYVHSTKIDSSKIKSGIFRRSYITNSLIENDDFITTRALPMNSDSIKSLVVSDSLFKDTGNILSKSTYLHSSFNNGSDEFKNGVVFRSIWKGLTFSNGIFRESTWFKWNLR